METTESQPRRIVNAKNFQELLEKIRNQFVSPEKHIDYNNFCSNVILSHQDVFDPIFIERQIEQAKNQRNEERKRKSNNNLIKRKEEVEKYLKESLVVRQMVVNDLELYKDFPDNPQKIILNLKKALDLEGILYNNNIANKIYIGQLLKKMKSSFEDVNIFLAYLMLEKIQISKTEMYFSLSLAKLAEEYHKIILLSVPLRYIRANMKIIEDILKKDTPFWKNIDGI